MTLSTRLTLAMVALVTLTAAAAGLLIYGEIERRALPRALERLDLDVRLLAFRLDASVQSARADVSTQGRGIEGLVQAILSGGADRPDGVTEDQWRTRLASRFAAELNAKPTYSQFRLIGIADGGREIVRADRMGPGGAVRVTPQQELQRKGDRSYFKAAIVLARGTTYASDVELNRENGTIEQPPVPTLRVAAPVFGPDQKPFGILIVNIDMRSIFASLRASRQFGDIYIVNQRGDYLVHPNTALEFGFERGNPARIQADLPEFSSLLRQDETPGRVVADRNGTAFAVGWEMIRLADGPRVTLLEIAPYSTVLPASTAWPTLFAGLVVMLLALPFVVLLTRSLTRPLAQMTEAVEQFSRDGTMRLPTDAGGEIGVLARAFETMAASVKEKTAALEREIEERQRFFDSSVDLILVTDRQGNFVRVSPSSMSLVGYFPEEMVGRSAIEFIHPDDLESTRHEMRIARRGRGTCNCDIRYLHRDGRFVSLAWTGVFSEQAQQYYFIGRDTTEQKKAAAALRESEQLARGIVMDALDAIIQVNERGEVVEWNPQAEAMLGWSRDEAIGQLITSLYLPQGYQPRYVAMNERLRHVEMTVERFDFEAHRKDGGRVKLEVSMTGVRRR